MYILFISCKIIKEKRKNHSRNKNFGKFEIALILAAGFSLFLYIE